LFRNAHTCCVCRETNKDVHIHHIDSKPTNNDPKNLAVVCLDCHSKITGPRGLGRSYKPAEVLLYKLAWEEYVELERQPSRAVVGYLNELLAKIDLVITETLALPDDDSRIDVLIEQLRQLHLWRNERAVQSKIVEGIGHLGAMSALSGRRIVDALPRFLWEMCHGYVGPDHVELTEDGKAQVLACIEALGTVGSLNAGFGRRRQSLDSLGLAFESFANQGLWYDDHEILGAALKELTITLEAGREERLFVEGQHVLLRALSSIEEALVESGPDWSAERQSVGDLNREYGLVYFGTSSKDGVATLDIEHPAAEQTLIVPVYPEEAVTEVMPFLEPDVRHYAGQWKKFMVPDPWETDGRGFFIEARRLPGPIAAPAHKNEIDKIATAHLTEEVRRFYEPMLPVPALSFHSYAYSSSAPWTDTPEDFDILMREEEAS
jgi:hypothetical protein